MPAPDNHVVGVVGRDDSVAAGHAGAFRNLEHHAPGLAGRREAIVRHLYPFCIGIFPQHSGIRHL